MPKDNSLFKLDNLDYQYHYLNGSLQNFSPRLNGTWKMYNAIAKKSSKRISRILNSLKIEGVERELDELSADIFKKKVFHLEVRLRRFIKRQLIQYKPGKKSKADFTAVINEIKDKYGIEKFACWISKSKTIKLSLSKIHSIRKWPKWFTNYEFWQIHNDRDHEYNPSRIWNDIILKVDGCNRLLSLLFNNENCKELIATFNSGMDVFLNINKDKKNNRECNASHVLPQLSSVQKEKSRDDSDGISESQLQDEDGEKRMAEETLKRYDDLLVASDDENEEDYDEVLPKADYQPNDYLEENMDESEKGHQTVKPKYQLPELISGYYDGDDSADDNLVYDEVAQEQISNNIHKKNRRGQRARRRIWEQKYGNKANHVMKERQVQLEKKRKRQQEFEERKARRIMRTAKASNLDEEISNLSKNDVPNKCETKGKSKIPLAEHPSWIAKRESETKLKNAKFEGRKIVFD